MHLNTNHKISLAWLYIICFGINFAWIYFNELLLVQIDPVIFINKLDISLNYIFLTGIHQKVIQYEGLKVFLDISWILINLALAISVIKRFPSSPAFAFSAIIFNWVYALLHSSFSTLSIEGFAAWILFPFLFATLKDRTFYYHYHFIRYAFIIIFLSTGLWKLRAGGIFNADQMSAILIKQHADIIYDNSVTGYKKFILFLINDPLLSYTIYLLATGVELSFIAGLITKKADRILLFFYILFIGLNYVFMQINYFPWLVFAGLLWYSRLKEQATNR